MIPAPLSTEILMLGCAVALVLLQIVLQACAGAVFLGLGYLMGPRDQDKPVSNPYAGRINRALHNVLETFPLFAALAVALAVTGRTGGQAAFGAQVYVWARTIYVPVYVMGIPVLRTLVWAASIAGIVLMLKALLIP